METKQKTISLVAALLVLVVLTALPMTAGAGNVGAKGPAGPTMKTLDEVEPRIPISQADIPLTISSSGSYYLTEDIRISVAMIVLQLVSMMLQLTLVDLFSPARTYRHQASAFI